MDRIVDLEPTEDKIYDRIGEDGFARLVRAFYAQVPGDAILGVMYPPEDLAGAEARLRMRHMPFAIDQAARDRWVQLMDRALDETALPADVSATLREFFHGTATFMINRTAPLVE